MLLYAVLPMFDNTTKEERGHVRCDLFLIAHAGAARFIPKKVAPAVFCRGAIHRVLGRDESRPYDAPLTSCTKMPVESSAFGVNIFSRCPLHRYGRSFMKSANGSEPAPGFNLFSSRHEYLIGVREHLISRMRNLGLCAPQQRRRSARIIDKNMKISMQSFKKSTNCDACRI